MGALPRRVNMPKINTCKRGPHEPKQSNDSTRKWYEVRAQVSDDGYHLNEEEYAFGLRFWICT